MLLSYDLMYHVLCIILKILYKDRTEPMRAKTRPRVLTSIKENYYNFCVVCHRCVASIVISAFYN